MTESKGLSREGEPTYDSSMDSTASAHLEEPQDDGTILPLSGSAAPLPHQIEKAATRLSSLGKTWVSINPSLAVLLAGVAIVVLGIEIGVRAPFITVVGEITLLIGVAGLMGSKRAAARARLHRANIGTIDSMPGDEFEQLLITSFELAGNVANHIGGRGDFGADLILTYEGVRTVVQAKRWTGTVGPGAVQEVAAARAHYGAQKALVVTNSTYTPAARALAKSNRVELWDRSDLIQVISAHSQDPPEVGMALLKSQLKAGVPQLLKRVGVACLLLLGTLISLGSAIDSSGKKRRRSNKRRRR